MKPIPTPVDDFRFYSFVAGLYLSPLQHGLQTAHCVSEMYTENYTSGPLLTRAMGAFNEWAYSNKTIIICNALNSKGVLELYEKLKYFADLYNLPATLFREDEASLNGAATAAAIIVPKKYFDVEFVNPDLSAPEGSVAAGARYRHKTENGGLFEYCEGNPEFEFVALLKSYRLA